MSLETIVNAFLIIITTLYSSPHLQLRLLGNPLRLLVFLFHIAPPAECYQRAWLNEEYPKPLTVLFARNPQKHNNKTQATTPAPIPITPGNDVIIILFF